jgi:hypothetical protein
MSFVYLLFSRQKSRAIRVGRRIRIPDTEANKRFEARPYQLLD